MECVSRFQEPIVRRIRMNPCSNATFMDSPVVSPVQNATLMQQDPICDTVYGHDDASIDREYGYR